MVFVLNSTEQLLSLGYFGVENYLESQGIADYVKACALGWSGEDAERGNYKKVAKSLLTIPSGGTSLDVSGLERELDKHALVLSVSDGEVNVSDDEEERFEEKLKECDFVHIQIGGETEFSQYLKEIGVPVVLPSNTPDMICTLSDSFLCVVTLLCPGFRLSRSFCISLSDNLIFGGQPSTTQPIAGPCDSPHVVSRNIFP